MAAAKPSRIWIDGSCFSVKKYQDVLKKSKKVLSNECQRVVPSPEVIHDFNIVPLPEGDLFTTFRLPSYYYTKLYQFPSFAVKDLEEETSTAITVPKNGNEGNIKITGKNKDDIASARSTIHSILSEIRDRSIAAQFIAIPVNSEEVVKNFEAFKKEVLNIEGIDGLDTTIFQSSLKLHLTVNVFALMDTTEKNEAIKALNGCKRDVIDPFIANTGPLRIKVAGLGCMNDNLTKVNVLYANATFTNDENNLQKIVNSISTYFYEKGLVRRYEENVKLHVTLINTKYRKDTNSWSPQKKKYKWGFKKQPLDASKIMEKFKDYYFGESAFDAIHLSYISSTGANGFYKPLSTIQV